MSQKITVGYKQLLAEAEAAIDSVTAEQAIADSKRQDVVIVDIRDPREIDREGRIPQFLSCAARHARILGRP